MPTKNCARKKTKIHGKGTIYSIRPGNIMSIAMRGKIVMKATTLKNMGYQGSTMEPIKRLAIVFARRLAKRLWMAANPMRYRAIIREKESKAWDLQYNNNQAPDYLVYRNSLF
jgi:hypothetical protein